MSDEHSHGCHSSGAFRGNRTAGGEGESSMTLKEIIAQLEDLKTDRESFVDKDDTDDVFRRDIDALDGAIMIIKKFQKAEEVNE